MRVISILAAITLSFAAYAEDGLLTPIQIAVEPIVVADPHVPLPGVYLVNPGADVRIYVIEDTALFNQFNKLPKEWLGMVLGCFDYAPCGFPQPRMVLLGHWSKEIEVALHEYTHYLEYMIPDKRMEIRSAFHKLATPEFAIGAGDLKDPAENEGKRNPLIIGFPTSDE